MRRKKVTAMTLTVFLSLSLMSACSNKQVDYTLDETEQDEDGTGNVKGLEQFADAEIWDEMLSVETSDGISGEIRIRAEPIVPEKDGMAVVEIYQEPVDAAYKEQLIKAFFGESEVFSSEEIIFWNQPEEAPVVDYEAQNYRGEIDGNTYGLAFREHPFWYLPVAEAQYFSNYRNEVGMGRKMNDQHIFLYPINGEVHPQGIAADSFYEPDFYNDLDEENQCTLSEEEAKERADTLLEKLGLSYFVYVDSSDACWKEYELKEIAEESWHMTTLQYVKDGYVFTYGQEWENWLFENFAQVSWVTVSVNDAGILNLVLSNPYHLVSATENVGLLPLETVQKIMRQELTDHAEEYISAENTTLFYRYFWLMYGEVTDPEQENYHSYIPVWGLSTDSDGADAVIVNAIDGSVYKNLEDVSLNYFH